MNKNERNVKNERNMKDERNERKMNKDERNMKDERNERKTAHEKEERELAPEMSADFGISKEERELPLEMSGKVAADFGISKEDMRPMKLGRRRTRGIFVPVSKAVYEAYMRPLWREAKREERKAPVVSLDRVRDEYEMEIGAESDVARAAEAAEAAEAVRRALEKLPEKERKILTLFAKGHTTAETAKALGMTERAVRYRKKAGLLKMRERLWQ